MKIILRKCKHARLYFLDISLFKVQVLELFEGRWCFIGGVGFISKYRALHQGVCRKEFGRKDRANFKRKPFIFKSFHINQNSFIFVRTFTQLKLERTSESGAIFLKIIQRIKRGKELLRSMEKLPRNILSVRVPFFFQFSSSLKLENSYDSRLCSILCISEQIKTNLHLPRKQSMYFFQSISPITRNNILRKELE